ncbi:hypothetical protein SAMN05192575_110116 [Nocardioides alpinus]|uniref:Uncharacterized protein n=1 Tax=Nocardioides alpinus TaxID=748909 RepID=A0A1I1AS61_9ACTN|nr:hypothetical protein [Nocardioides alpinus]PKH40311.1 hypothetical protein CXG46_13035 [Nocardioides alpinus]SFB40737.1 hypothetical protein SAMN05192575_110116 [Nocardioides alpinus]
MKIETHTPHIEPDWAEAFLLELRLRGVGGQRIGAALAEVEAHCAESGESAREAFGDPAAYAVELAPARSVVAPDVRRELGTSALGLGGMLLTLAAVGAWQSGARVEVTAGIAAVLVLVLVGTTLVVSRAEQLLRAVVRHWWVAMLGATLPIVLFVGVLLLGRQTVFTVAAMPAFVAGVALLAGSTARSIRTADTVGDPVVGPEGAGGAGTVGEDRVTRALERVGPWLFPVLTVVMALPLLLI